MKIMLFAQFLFYDLTKFLALQAAPQPQILVIMDMAQKFKILQFFCG
jgi:hypothetical protein